MDNTEEKTLTCQWCGLEAPASDFEMDMVHENGFWCPDCDGHTFFDPEKNRKRRMLLLLETEAAGQAQDMQPKTGLRKRLSPLRYPGGKSKLIDALSGYFSLQKMDRFVEVFAGGASVGLALLDAGRIGHLVINDTDPGVYAFWSVVVSSPESLIKRIKSLEPDRKMVFGLRDMLGTPGFYSENDLAWAQLVCNRCLFSGITTANPMKDLLSRWNPDGLIKRIERVHAMRDRITVSRIDALELIEQSAYWDGQSTCFIDPPYVKAGSQLYRRYFEDEDHEQLAFLLRSLYQGMPGADLIITYDDCELIRSLYPEAEIVRIPRKYSCRKYRKEA